MNLWTSTTFTPGDCSDTGIGYRTYGLNGTDMNLGRFCATTLSSTSNAPGYTMFGSVRCGIRKIAHSQILFLVQSRVFYFKE